jgi:hypothetical protein
MQRVRRKNDVAPDGVRIVVAWGDFLPNTSIFIPCINTEAAKQQLKQICDDLHYETIIKIIVNNGKLGVRIWRIA